MNGKSIHKGSTVHLNGGDEVVFGLSGKHAYVSFFPAFTLHAAYGNTLILYSL